MLAEVLWPKAMDLQVDLIEVVDENLVVIAHGTQETALCPECQKISNRIHSHYRRHPADLPCVSYGVQIQLTVPRFFCDNEHCLRRTFAARFPALVPAYARRTNRLATQQQTVGFTVSAETGARLLAILGMITSPDTLIRLVRRTSESEITTPRILGVDDWSYRKGHSYGTILVDLEEHKVIDLLEDRSAESLIEWLQAHPGVEIITRDRGKDYIEGATTGAPGAVQIADRFHLFQNIVDSLKRMLQKQPQTLREAARLVAADQQESANEQAAEAAGIVQATSLAEAGKKQQLTLQELRFAEVKKLQTEGESQRFIAKHLSMDRRTIRKYFALDTCPKRTPRYQSISKATPYEAYLSKRWQEGYQNIAELHAEIEAMGFEGSYGSVYRAMKRLLKQGQLTPIVSAEAIPIPKLSVTEATWLLLHQDERLDDNQQKLRDTLCQINSDVKRARHLAQSFCRLLRERQADELDSWLTEAEQSSIKALKNFATGLRRDYDAVKAALTYEWSQGQVEGQVNRLKLIKREMYGRANFDLLRKKVIGAPMLC